MTTQNIVDSTLWESIRTRGKSIEIGMNPLQRKRTGSYYTGLELTDAMINELVSLILDDGKQLENMKFFEPCVGTGNFVFSYLKKVKLLNYPRYKIKKIINNIYVADINAVALMEYKNMLMEYVASEFDITLDEDYFSKHIGSGLLIDVDSALPKYISLQEVFDKEICESGFDIIVTNPPYKNLKAEKGQYESDEEYEIDKEKYAMISKIVRKQFNYSADGVLNLYKLFVEEIVDKYANEDAYVDLLIPSSILSDKTCYKLRTHLLTTKDIKSVKIIREGSGYIDAQQALTTLLLKNSNETKSISVTKDYCKQPDQSVKIDITDILNDNTGNAIFAINAQEYGMLKQLRKYPVVKDIPYVINLRGELDLTANKSSIVSENTGYPLLRGRNINYYELVDLNREEYVSPEFVYATKKHPYIGKKRIICQQVVNMHKNRRVTFAYVPENYVLGNSCNFIVVDENTDGVDLYAVLGLFNTSIINWLFKLTSSNNHVNNYEIDCFPIPIKSEYLKQISTLTREYLKNRNPDLLDKIEKYAFLAYEIASTDDYEKDESKMKEHDLASRLYQDLKYILPNITLEISKSILEGDASVEAVILQAGIDISKFEKNVVSGICKKYIKMKKKEVFNHTTFKLSELDMEMITAVPQGGNWKDIPMETVEKSKRLKRITETGGRTTLYGRIDYDKPSYTITTYFNRPGNGTYVHPVHDRVLSVREAARFQCFPDDYYFFGNKTQMLKQVGNAVPTLLAYQIAKNIVDKTECIKSIDLFCGAGGMTAGFKEAGIKSMLSNDIEESVCTTLKINNPEIDTFIGDITDSSVKEHIIETAKRTGAEIICGGPPCQGFSMAGFRLADDPRNQLFKEFVEVVSKVNPKIIVFENVEGLLSFQGGKVYQAILNMFAEIGYMTEGRTLMTNHYGVPQRRKRVIIICTRNDLNVKPEDIFPTPITEEEGRQITARQTMEDLEKVVCGEEASYLEGKTSDIVKMFKRQISYGDFIKIIRTNKNWR